MLCRLELMRWFDTLNLHNHVKIPELGMRERNFFAEPFEIFTKLGATPVIMISIKSNTIENKINHKNRITNLTKKKGNNKKLTKTVMFGRKEDPIWNRDGLLAESL